MEEQLMHRPLQDTHLHPSCTHGSAHYGQITSTLRGCPLMQRQEGEKRSPCHSSNRINGISPRQMFRTDQGLCTPGLGLPATASSWQPHWIYLIGKSSKPRKAESRSSPSRWKTAINANLYSSSTKISLPVVNSQENTWKKEGWWVSRASTDPASHDCNRWKASLHQRQMVNLRVWWVSYARCWVMNAPDAWIASRWWLTAQPLKVEHDKC